MNVCRVQDTAYCIPWHTSIPVTSCVAIASKGANLLFYSSLGFNVSLQGETWVADAKLIRLHSVLVGFMQLFLFAIIFVAVSLLFWAPFVNNLKCTAA